MDKNKMVKIEELKGKDIEEIVGMIEINNDISIRNKIAAINALVGTLLTKDNYGMYTYDSITKDIMTKVTYVSLVTNIDLYDDYYDNYDVLQSTGLFDYLDDNNLSLFNFEQMLDDKIYDIMRENDVEHILAERTDEMLMYVNRTLKHVDSMLDKGDPNKIAKYLSKGVEAIANKLPDMSALEVADRFKANFQPKAKNNNTKENIKEAKEDKKAN